MSRLSPIESAFTATLEALSANCLINSTDQLIVGRGTHMVFYFLSLKVKQTLAKNFHSKVIFDFHVPDHRTS